MEKFTMIGWLLVVIAAASIEAFPYQPHAYLEYVHPYGNTRHSFGYNPTMYPYKMFNFPAMPAFPEMKLPAMPKLNFGFPKMHSNQYFNNYDDQFNKMMGFHGNSANAHYNKMPNPVAPVIDHQFKSHFNRLMGFHGINNNNNLNNLNNFPYNNNVNPAHANGYNNNNNNNNHHDNNKGNSYGMSYSKSYSMNMDMTNGKGHMVTKGSSYLNDNGKVYQSNNPEQHYVANGNGKFMPVDNYNH